MQLARNLAAPRHRLQIGVPRQQQMAIDRLQKLGPARGIVVTRTVLDENAANRGILSRSNEQSETARIEVKNIGTETWPLTVFDRVPYSTQEDLQITWRADPRPTVTDWQDMRGVLGWEMTIAPGETRTITLSHTLEWPDGKELR